MLYNEIGDDSKKETAVSMLEFLLAGEFGPEAQELAKNFINESADIEEAAVKLQEWFDDGTEVEELDSEDVNGDGDTDVTTVDTSGDGEPDAAVVEADSEAEESEALDKSFEKLGGDDGGKTTSTGKTEGELEEKEDTVSDEKVKEKKDKKEKNGDKCGGDGCTVSDRNMKNVLPSHIVGCLSDRLY